MKEATYVIRPPMYPCFPTHIHWSGENRLFTPMECLSIIEAGEAQPQGFATIGNGGGNQKPGVNLEYRTVKSCTLWRQASGVDLTWMYERIANKVAMANLDYYRFDLSGIGEGVQFLKYAVFENGSGHYLWHQDFGGDLSSNRKLSLVVNLSDPADYEGCRLELMNERQWEVPYIGQGEAIMFPSWTPHQVTLITAGTRYALAVWIHGPQFR